MAIQNFDELNTFKRRSLPYDEFFGDMELTDKQKKERKDMALILEDILSIIFEVILAEVSIGVVDKTHLKQETIEMIYDKISDEDFFEDDEQLEDYIDYLLDVVVDKTIENYEKQPDVYDYKGEKPYWVSDDRAMFIAENEANTLFNSQEYVEAKKQGYTKKIWMAFPDDRVRETHQIANGLEIDVGDYFEVGEAQMLYPRDLTSEYSTLMFFPEEYINCRCTVKYV